MKKNLLAEESELKYKQIDYCYRNVGIGQIEDCAEEVVVAVYQELQQTRYIFPLEKGKIEHVHHLAHHESGVMPAEFGYRVGGGLRKEQPVECAVEDVAQGARKDQGQSDKYPLRGVGPAAVQVSREPTDDADHGDAEETEQELAPVIGVAQREAHAERGALVLDEVQLEPVGEDCDRFVEVHVGFDPDLQRLVCYDQQQYEQRYFFEIHLVWFGISHKSSKKSGFSGCRAEIVPSIRCFLAALRDPDASCKVSFTDDDQCCLSPGARAGYYEACRRAAAYCMCQVRVFQAEAVDERSVYI